MKTTSGRWIGAAALLHIGLLTAAAPDSLRTDWSGHWQQNNERSVPPPRNKSYSYQMDVQLSGSLLQVHIDMTGGRGEKKLDLTYEIGGKEIVYTGTDGDEFHSKAQWSGKDIVFTIVEHERGRLIPFTETWTLIDSGKSMRRVKTGKDPDEDPKTVSILERRDAS